MPIACAVTVQARTRRSETSQFPEECVDEEFEKADTIKNDVIT